MGKCRPAQKQTCARSGLHKAKMRKLKHHPWFALLLGLLALNMAQDLEAVEVFSGKGALTGVPVCIYEIGI